MVCLSPSDDEKLRWEAAQFIKRAVVWGLLSLPALTASQRLFTSSKYDRLYVNLTVCLCECACVEVMEEEASPCARVCTPGMRMRFKVVHVPEVDTVTPVR